MNQTNQRPEKSFKVGGVSVAVWKWDNTTRNGQGFTQHKTTVERRYKDASGNWKSTNSFAVNDIPKAMLALSKAYEYLNAPEANGGIGEVIVEDVQ